MSDPAPFAATPVNFDVDYGGPTNRRKAGFAAAAMVTYFQHVRGDGDVATLVVDLLTDLRHFCDGHGIDFADVDDLAAWHYNEERQAKP